MLSQRACWIDTPQRISSQPALFRIISPHHLKSNTETLNMRSTQDCWRHCPLYTELILGLYYVGLSGISVLGLLNLSVLMSCLVCVLPLSGNGSLSNSSARKTRSTAAGYITHSFKVSNHVAGFIFWSYSMLAYHITAFTCVALSAQHRTGSSPPSSPTS